jgi:hypothetical protein
MYFFIAFKKRGLYAFHSKLSIDVFFRFIGDGHLDTKLGHGPIQEHRYVVGIGRKRLIVGFYEPNVVNFFKFKGFYLVVIRSELEPSNFVRVFEGKKIRGPGGGIVKVFPQ